MAPLWTPLLFTAGSSSRYGFVVLAPHDHEIAHLVALQGGLGESRGTEPHWILGAVGNRVFFGRWGWIADRLGPDHPAAVDRVQRKLEFFLGYSAPLGTPVPAFADLRRVEDTVTADLRRFTENDGASRSVTKPPETPFDFSPFKSGGHLWDRAAGELGQGRAIAPIIIDARGSVRSARTAPPPPAAGPMPSDERQANLSEYKSEDTGGSAGMRLIAMGAAATAGVAALLCALRRH